MTRPRGSSFATRLILGVAVILVGVVLTLDNFSMVNADKLLLYWPVALIALGLTRIFSRRAGDRIFGSAFLLGGLWILLFNVEIVDIEPWKFFWPIVFILIGTTLILGGTRRRAAVPAEAGSSTDGFAFLSGLERKNSSADYRGGELTAIMGGCGVDLRQARIAEGGAPVLGVFAFWGGIEIRVPHEWRVDNQVVPFLGGVEDTTETTAPGDGPCLTLKGFAVMGGVEVKN